MKKLMILVLALSFYTLTPDQIHLIRNTANYTIHDFVKAPAEYNAGEFVGGNEHSNDELPICEGKSRENNVRFDDCNAFVPNSLRYLFRG